MGWKYVRPSNRPVGPINKEVWKINSNRLSKTKDQLRCADLLTLDIRVREFDLENSNNKVRIGLKFGVMIPEKGRCDFSGARFDVIIPSTTTQIKAFLDKLQFCFCENCRAQIVEVLMQDELQWSDDMHKFILSYKTSLQEWLDKR